jgi:hypothetical protein
MERTINFTYDVASETFTVEGIKISFFTLPLIIHELTHPDPRKWYRFERRDDTIIVHVRISEEEVNGYPIASIGQPAAQTNPGGEGSEAPHRGDAYTPFREQGLHRQT